MTSTVQPLISFLIADAHPIERLGLSRELAQFSDLALVGEVEDGEKLLEQIPIVKPQLVLVDMNLPGLNGIQVARQVRQNWPQTAVIALGNHADRHYVWSFLAEGGRGILLKTEYPAVIAAGIRQVAQGQVALSLAVQTVLVQAIAQFSQQLGGHELKIVQLLSQGLGDKEISQKLGISEGTLQCHLNNIYRKLPMVRNRSEVVAWAWINRLVYDVRLQL